MVKTLLRSSGFVFLLFILMSGYFLTACDRPGTSGMELPSVDTLSLQQHIIQGARSGQVFSITGVSSEADQLYAPVPGPDLIIESITWSPQNLSKGDTLTISVTVKNQGDARSKTSSVSLFVNGMLKDEQVLTIIEAGSTVKKDFTWIAQEGSTVFRLVVDVNNIVAESDETNNEKSVTISSLVPDLIVQSISWLPTSPLLGDNVTFSLMVRNQGEGKAVSSYGYFYVDNERLDTINFDALEPGQVGTRTLSWPVKSGIYTIKLEIDPNNNIQESEDNNNTKTVDFTPILPDLFVNNITWSPTTPSIGDMVSFNITIGNQGRAISSSSIFHFYIGDVLSIPGIVNNITVGGTDTITLSWVAQPGQHKIKVILDPYNEIIETVESNNQVTWSNLLSVRAADLAIESATWSPEEASPDDTLTLSVIIRNRGYGEAASTRLNFYVDGVLSDSSNIGTLSYGNIQTNTFTWIVEEGSHVFRFTADSNHIVLEGNEDNNEYIVFYPVPPDLVLKNISLSPSEPVEGDNVTFIISTENQGGVIAESYNIACYIDDVYVSYMSGGFIASGGSGNLTFTWAAESGGHNCRAIVDPFNNLFEASEENNEKTVSFIVHKATSGSVTTEPTAPVTRSKEPGTVLPGKPSTDSKEAHTELWFFSLLGGGVVILLSYLFFEYKRRHE